MANEVTIHVRAKSTRSDFTRLRSEFRQVGAGISQAFHDSVQGMLPHLTRLGGLLGVALATGLAAKAAAALSALLPLALGGILAAGPIVYLIKGMVEDGSKSWEKLKKKAISFIDYISKPFKVPLVQIFKDLGKWLDKMKAPIRDMMAALAPALRPFVKGVLQGVENFIKAIAPKMPSIAEGFKAWGAASAKIGKGMGEFLAKLMKDPEGTVKAVDDLANSLLDLSKSAGELVASLKYLSEKWDKFVELVNKYDKSMYNGEIPGFPSTADFAKYRAALGKAFRWIQREFGEARASLIRNHAPMVRQISQAWDRISSAVVRGVKAAIRAITGFVADTKRRWNDFIAAGRRMVSDMSAGFNNLVAKIRSGANRAVALVRDLKKRFENAFDGARGWLEAKGKAVIDGLFDGLKKPFEAVKTWVSGIAKWIKDNKGPISLDRQLLEPAGKALMGGLLNGLKFGFGPVGDFVYGAGSKITDIISKIKDSVGPSGNGGMGAVGSGMAGARRAALRLGASSVGGHRETGSGRPAWDIMVPSKAVGNRIAAHLRAHRGAYGLGGNIIWNMRITNSGRGWEWGPYSPIRRTGDYRHVRHVHASFADGGWINEPVFGVGRSGKTYSFGEKESEYVTPRGRMSGAPGRGGIVVNAVTNADPYRIASEVAWVLKTGGY